MTHAQPVTSPSRPSRIHERFRIDAPMHSLREAGTVERMALGIPERLASTVAAADLPRLLAADGDAGPPRPASAPSRGFSPRPAAGTVSAWP